MAESAAARGFAPARHLHAVPQDFTADFPPDMRGVAIGNADGIRQAHNSFAPPEAQLSDPESRKATDSDELYHFVSYVHKAGALWELDGLQEGPIRCCECAKVRPQPLRMPHGVRLHRQRLSSLCWFACQRLLQCRHRVHGSHSTRSPMGHHCSSDWPVPHRRSG